MAVVIDGQRDPVDAPALHAFDAEGDDQGFRILFLVVGCAVEPQCDRVVTDGDAAELLVDQAGDRLVVLALRQRDPGLLLDLVRTQQARQRPGAVAAVPAA